MKSLIQNAALLVGFAFSAIALAGNQPATGGGGQGTGSTSNGAAAGSAMISAVAASGATVTTASDGTITIAGGATNGVSFPATVVTHAGQKYVVSAKNGVITLVPVE